MPIINALHDIFLTNAYNRYNCNDAKCVFFISLKEIIMSLGYFRSGCAICDGKWCKWVGLDLALLELEQTKNGFKSTF